MTKNWNLNPETGDYVLVGGAPENVETLKIPAYIRLKTKRQKWMYAPDLNYGSDLYLIVRKKNGETSSQVEDTSAKALQPIVDDDRATSIEVETTQEARHALGLKITVTDAGGRTENIDIKPLGV